jgi:hypothetical protein
MPVIGVSAAVVSTYYAVQLDFHQARLSILLV